MPTRRARDIQKYRDFYARKAGAPFVMKEFGFYCEERWRKEGHIAPKQDLNELFDFDEPGTFDVFELGWCESALCPHFRVQKLEDRGAHEVVRDAFGRHVLYFKGRRSGFMPEYLDHPVKDFKTWEENVKWRLDPASPKRFLRLQSLAERVCAARAEGKIICERLCGGYAFLRSLIGPESLLYMFYDNPALVHECMRAWFELSDAVLAKHQRLFDIDELFMSEDICYNAASLISHDMMREFLFPYYRQLIANVRARQKDRARELYIQIDTDGAARTVIDVYREIGMNSMSPFEVASGNDVVELRKQYPDLLMSGGFDKRILARGKAEIDREIDRVMPFMMRYGGYIPTCDHGVPEEVSFENYVHFRKRLKEFS